MCFDPVLGVNEKTIECIFGMWSAKWIMINFFLLPDKLMRSGTPFRISFSICWTSSLCTDCKSFKSWRNSSRWQATGMLCFQKPRNLFSRAFITVKLSQNILWLLSHSYWWDSSSFSLKIVENCSIPIRYLVNTQVLRDGSARVSVVKKHPTRMRASPSLA